MPETIPSPIGCGADCSPSYTQGPPGAQGATGAAGTNGTDGLNAFSTATGGEEMPAGGDSVTVATEDSTAWMAVGAVIYVNSWGWMRVEEVLDANSVVLSNLDDGTNYAGNAAAGTVLPALARIAPSGPQGPTGETDSSLFLQRALNLSDLENDDIARFNLGFGTIANYNKGVLNGTVPLIDDASGLGANQFVVGTGIGIKGLTVAEAYALLGLGSVAVYPHGNTDGSVPSVDQTGGLVANNVVFATTSGLKTLDAASARAALGITTGGTSFLLFVDQRPSGVNSTSATGGVDTVPLNNEAADDGNYGSLASNVVTLAAGTYRFNYGVTAYNAARVVAWLYDLDASPPAALPYSNSTLYAPTGSTVIAQGNGEFTIDAPHRICLQAVLNGGSSPNFGQAASLGYLEQYSWLKLERV